MCLTLKVQFCVLWVQRNINISDRTNFKSVHCVTQHNLMFLCKNKSFSFDVTFKKINLFNRESVH